MEALKSGTSQWLLHSLFSLVHLIFSCFLRNLHLAFRISSSFSRIFSLAWSLESLRLQWKKIIIILLIPLINPRVSPKSTSNLSSESSWWSKSFAASKALTLSWKLRLAQSILLSTYGNSISVKRTKILEDFYYFFCFSSIWIVHQSLGETITWIDHRSQLWNDLLPDSFLHGREDEEKVIHGQAAIHRIIVSYW